MTELFFNGKPVSEEEFAKLVAESQDVMIDEEERVADEFCVSHDTAAAICYLRSRSRWTQEKETTLVERDRAGDAVPLRDVLSGDF